MKVFSRCLLLASIFLMVLSAADAQQPSGGRRTELEYLDRGFDLEGITAPEYPPDFWQTPAGKALYERNQMEKFSQNVGTLTELGREDWTSRYDSFERGRDRREFEERVESLEKASGQMIEFFEWKFEVEPLEVEELAGETVRDRLAAVGPRVEQILATITTLTGGGIPISEFVEMRRNLVRIHALSRSLGD